jgi:hypothetical protein
VGLTHRKPFIDAIILGWLFSLCFPLAVAYLIYQENSHAEYDRRHDHEYPFSQFTHI